MKQKKVTTFFNIIDTAEVYEFDGNDDKKIAVYDEVTHGKKFKKLAEELTSKKAKIRKVVLSTREEEVKKIVKK